MLANGPPCIKAGVFSSVCTRFGFIASFKRAAIEPTAFKSLAYTGVPSYVYAVSIEPRRSFKSLIPEERQSIAIISLATVIIKPSSRGTPFTLPPRPITTFLSALSFISRQRLKRILLGSMRSSFPC